MSYGHAEWMYGSVNNFNLGTIYAYFDKKNDRINIERIIKGEAKILNSAYEFAQKKAAKYINLKSVHLRLCKELLMICFHLVLTTHLAGTGIIPTR